MSWRRRRGRQGREQSGRPLARCGRRDREEAPFTPTENEPMSTTATRTNPAPADTVGRGFPGIPCLYCNDEGTIRLDLADVTAPDAFHCTACEAEFSLDDVRTKIAAWQPVLTWVALAPQLPEEAP